MSYLHKPHIKPLEHRLPFQLLQAHAKSSPNKEAFVFRDNNKKRTSLTFQEYDTNSRRLAAAFLEMCLKSGDRVLVMLPSRVEFVLVHMALNRIGANIILVEEDAYLAVTGIQNLACVIARNEMEKASPNHDKVLKNIQTALKDKNIRAAVIVSPSAGPLKDAKNVYLYKDLFHMSQEKSDWNDNVTQAEAKVQMDDPSVVLFTSGSTSIPKPIQHTNHGFVNGCLSCASLMSIKENSVLFSDCPFDWAPGVCLNIGAVITVGATLVAFPPKLSFQERLVNIVMKTIEEEKCTHATMLAHLLNDITTCSDIRDIDLTKLEVIMTGGQANPISLFKDVFDIMPHVGISISYGTTEIYLASQQLLTKDDIDTVSYGLMDAVQGVELKIVDDSGSTAPLNTKGELCVRAAWVSFCDWDLLSLEDKPSGTRTGKNGWHFTNDGASIDEHGKLRLHGRLDDVIKCATECITPDVIEDLLLSHRYVSRVCIVGVPDQRLYEKICACVILKDYINNNKREKLQNELDEYCSDNCLVSSLGMKLKPHYYVFLDEFPLTRTGKLSRRLTRELAIKKLGL